MTQNIVFNGLLLISQVLLKELIYDGSYVPQIFTAF